MTLDISELLEGNQSHVENFEGRFEDVQESQSPDYVTVCCSDSRVLQDAAWSNSTPGKIFTCGNIGNRVVQETPKGEVVSGDVVYPLAHTDTGTAVVMGHTGCGAVTAAYNSITDGLDEDEPDGIEHSVSLIEHDLEEDVERLPGDIDDDEAVNRLVERNVDTQVEKLMESEDVPDDVDVVGCVYDFQDVYSSQRGKIHVINVNGDKDIESLRDDYPGIDDTDTVRRLTSPGQ